MKIDIESLIKIHKTGIDFNTFFLLYIAQDGCNYMFSNLDYKNLKERGLVDFECKITPQGEELLANCMSNKIDKSIDFNKLHLELQEELRVLTGKKQKVINKKYAFLPNSTDLKTKLLKVSKKYNLIDWDKIKSLLLQHIRNSHKANWEYTILLEYYIEKNNSSKLATDYINEEIIEEHKEEVETPKSIKNLF
jgi:hypothetical protein